MKMSKVTVTGIPTALSLVRRHMAATVKSAEKSLEEMRSQAEEIARMAVMQTIRNQGEKSTGALGASMTAKYEKIAVGRMRLTVGSPLPQGFYASINIAETPIFRPVFIDPPGKWRFIGLRPPIPAHNFLEITESRLESLFTQRFGLNFDYEISRISPLGDSSMDAWSREVSEDGLSE
jgi:hypothetical protein